MLCSKSYHCLVPYYPFYSRNIINRFSIAVKQLQFTLHLHNRGKTVMSQSLFTLALERGIHNTIFSKSNFELLKINVTATGES